MIRYDKTVYSRKGTVKFLPKALYSGQGYLDGKFIFITSVSSDRSHLNFYHAGVSRMPIRAKIFVDENDNEYILVRLDRDARYGVSAVTVADYTRMSKYNYFKGLESYERFYPHNISLIACGINK